MAGDISDERIEANCREPILQVRVTSARQGPRPSLPKKEAIGAMDMEQSTITTITLCVCFVLFLNEPHQSSTDDYIFERMNYSSHSAESRGQSHRICSDQQTPVGSRQRLTLSDARGAACFRTSAYSSSSSVSNAPQITRPFVPCVRQT